MNIESLACRTALVAAGLAMASVNVAAAETSDVLLDARANAVIHGKHEGATVLWGGKVVDRFSADVGDARCIEIAQLPLDRKSGQPRAGYRPDGQHFLACTNTAWSSNYSAGKLVTVAGTLGRVEERFIAWGRGCHIPGVERTAHRADSHGCNVQLPVVAVADSHSWVDLSPFDAPGSASLTQLSAQP